jgi:hypothetical protein
MAAPLCAEDTLRLNVLLAGNVEAMRLDEGSMTLHALTERGEARVALHPNCRADQYLLRVRELLGGHALGSPGGYPVYLKRWTRMGQASGANLDALLLLGEPEAVVAVAHSPGLTDDLARRVWWAQPSMEIARCMLAQPAVAQGSMGRVLVDFLVEHMPFEEDADANLETMRLALSAGLADARTQSDLWAKARRQPYHYLAFLEFRPDALPADLPGRDVAEYAALHRLARSGNAYAGQLLRCFSPSGQTFLKAAAEVLTKPVTHHIVYHSLQVLGSYFAAVRPARISAQAVDELAAAADDLADLDDTQRAALAQVDGIAGNLMAELKAAIFLACLSDRVAEPVLTRTTAVGPLMRRKLEPVIAPIGARLGVLRGVPA